jgi:hypothetical protein
MYERIEGWLKTLDALERRGDQLGRAQFAVANQSGELSGWPEEKLVRHGPRTLFDRQVTPA